MRLMKVFVATLAVAAVFAVGMAGLRAADTTLTGKVSDATCGAKHMQGMSDADCVKECVKKGAYALVVKDKVYTLTATDAQKADLLKLAGKNAKVTGAVDGMKMTVTKVEAAK